MNLENAILNGQQTMQFREIVTSALNTPNHLSIWDESKKEREFHEHENELHAYLLHFNYYLLCPLRRLKTQKRTHARTTRWDREQYGQCIKNWMNSVRCAVDVCISFIAYTLVLLFCAPLRLFFSFFHLDLDR